MCLALIGVIVSGVLHLQASTGGLIATSDSGTLSNNIHQTSPAKTGQAGRHKPACLPLPADQTVKSFISSAHPVCFLVATKPGEARQLVINQPDDLEVHVRSGAAERLVDAFDFGNETVTITESGFHRVEVRLLPHHVNALAFSVTVRPLQPEEAARRQEAEAWATTANRSNKIEDINKSLTLWTALHDTASVARAYLLRGGVVQVNDSAKARPDFEKALELCRTISDVRCSAEAENNSGSMSRRLGDVDQASQRLEEAARDWQTLGNLTNEAKTRSNLGLQLWQSGDFEHAISNLDQAGRIQRGKDAVGYAKVLNNIGLCYQSLAEYEKAQGYFEGAIAGFTRGNSPPDLLRARLNLGRTHMLEGHLIRAQSILDQVLATATELADRRAIADSLRNLGQILWRQGKVGRSRSRVEEALVIDRDTGDRRGESSALHYLGLVAQRNGDLALARSFFTQAVQIRRESGLRDDAAESLSAVADLEYRQGRFGAAQDAAEQALKLLESVRSQVPSPALRASFYSRKRQFFALLVDMAMAPGTPKADVDGLLAAERSRGRALMDLLAGGSLLQQLPQDLAQRRASIQRQIDFLAYRLSQVPSDQQAGLREQIQLLVAEDEQVETRIRQSLAELKLGQPLTSIEEIQRNYLPPDSALLEYHLGANKSYLWLVDAQRVRTYVLPPAKTIAAEAAPVVEGFGRILERRRSPAKQAAFVHALRKLSTTLLGQLSDVRLPRLLILVPDGVLHRVPLAALQSSSASRPLGLVHDLVQIPSAAYLTFGKRPRPVDQFPKAILAFVDPVFSAGDPRMPHDHRQIATAESEMSLGRLPFTGEISTIESLVPANRRKIFRGFHASRATLDKLRLEDFGVLHFSTHALIDDRIPELSRIALSMFDVAGHSVDGFLRPNQLAQFHLDGSIVVLSACDTALGKQVLGEGLAGLTSSLLYAGGAQLVLTLTEVDAEASSNFLTEVYRRFLSGKASMELAIALARRAMAHSKQFSDPYYWASFIVVGQPAPTRPL